MILLYFIFLIVIFRRDFRLLEVCLSYNTILGGPVCVRFVLSTLSPSVALFYLILKHFYFNF
jgi:hypothetical protein